MMMIYTRNTRNDDNNEMMMMMMMMNVSYYVSHFCLFYSLSCILCMPNIYLFIYLSIYLFIYLSISTVSKSQSIPRNSTPKKLKSQTIPTSRGRWSWRRGGHSTGPRGWRGHPNNQRQWMDRCDVRSGGQRNQRVAGSHRQRHRP